MRITRTIGVSLFILLMAWAAWTCKDQITSSDLSSIVFPSSGVSFSKHVQPLFNAGCGGQSSSCHGSDTFDGEGFALDSYDHLMYGTRSVVTRGDSSSSLIITSIEGKSGAKMPPSSQAQLNSNQIQGLKIWIKEGAQNN